MIPKLAIEKAIEGGWKNIYLPNVPFEVKITESKYLVVTHSNGHEVVVCPIAEIALDPTFWQCLGKMLEWGDSCCHCNEHGFYEVYRHQAVCGLSSARAPWQIRAERLYHLILTGGDTHKFWDELLKEN